MTFGNAVRAAIAGVLLVPYAAIAAQELTFADLIKGERLPAKLEIAKIPDDFRAVKIKQAGSGGGGGGIFDMFGGSMMMMLGMLGSMGGASKEPPMEFFTAMEVSWTKGEVARISGQDYLITYKIDWGLSELMSMGESQNKPPKMEHVSLVLVRSDTIVSLTPQPEVTRQGYAEALTKLPSSGESSTPNSEQAKTVENAKQLSIAMIMYAGDNDDILPYVQDTKAAYYVTHPYVKNSSVMKTHNPNGGMLRFNMGIAGVAMTSIEEPANTPMYYDSNAWPDGSRVVAFTDSTTRVISAEDWPSIEANLRRSFPRAAKRPLAPTLGREWDRVSSGGSRGGG